jgi:glycosyltransferase involved in cell wall biosynthesis
VQRIARPALNLVRFYGNHVAPRLRPSATAGPQGINVIGFLTSEFGVGDAGRAFAQAAGRTGLPLALCNIENRTHRNADATFAGFSATNPYRVNLLATSVDHTRRYCRDHPRECAGHHNVGLWFWELENLPARWHGGFDWLDEVWTPTEFCRRAFADVSPVPVRKISYPLAVAPTPPARARFDLPEDARIFLCTFDFLSSIERKNPLAVIEAFRLAFGGSRDALLMLKTINSDRTPEARSLVAGALHGLNHRWSEPHITGAEMRSLTASCDCYVSLHRSEGLGLGMAQAMALGRPVIATNWSGNLEFMDATNSLLVDFRFVEIAQDVGKYYERGNRWAEADVDDAAAKMRRVLENRVEARQIGARAAAGIAERMNPERTAAEITARLVELGLVE